MKLKIPVTFIILLTLFQVATAQDVKIRLMNCSLDKAILTDIKHSLTFQLDFYASVFNRLADTTFTARVFANEKEFVKYARSKANFNPLRTHSLALYSSQLNEMILHLEVENFPRVFAHEISHAILNYYCKDASTWLDEGLAETLEDVVASDSTYFFNATQVPKVKWVRSYLSQGSSIRDGMDAKDFYKPPLGHRNYSVSFGTVLYLYLMRKDVLIEIVKSDCSSAHSIFDLHYPEGLDLLEVDVKSWFLNYNSTLD